MTRRLSTLCFCLGACVVDAKVPKPSPDAEVSIPVTTQGDCCGLPGSFCVDPWYGDADCSCSLDDTCVPFAGEYFCFEIANEMVANTCQEPPEITRGEAVERARLTANTEIGYDSKP